MDTETLNHKAILDMVKTWSKPRRLELVQEIIQGMITEVDSPLADRKNTVDNALGLLRKYTDNLPPTDEDVQRWLEEERLKKYSRE